MSERGAKLAARSDEEWFALMHRCGNITCKAACGTSYERVTGKRFPIESYRKWEASLAKKTSCWRGVWLSAADYAAAPEWAKRYCEHKRWVEYIGKYELPDGKDGRKMDYAYICTKMEDADWDFSSSTPTHTLAVCRSSWRVGTTSARTYSATRLRDRLRGLQCRHAFCGKAVLLRGRTRRIGL